MTGLHGKTAQKAKERNELHKSHARSCILNLARKINYYSKIYENYSHSVHQLGNDLRQEDFDPVLCYKREQKTQPLQGIICPCDPNQFPERPILRPLHTYLLHLHLQIQVSPLLGTSDREDTATVQLFLCKLQEKHPEATVTTVMTDAEATVTTVMTDEGVCVSVLAQHHYTWGIHTDKIGWSASKQASGQGTRHLLSTGVWTSKPVL